MRRKGLAANSFLFNLAQQGQDRSVSSIGTASASTVRSRKNKTFFLFTGEKYREGTPAPEFSTVPTEAMKDGDFSNIGDTNGNLITIYDPATGHLENGAWVRIRSQGTKSSRRSASIRSR